MKQLKMLGLTTMAAMALTAAVGAGTASATVTCKTEPTPVTCPIGWAYPGNTMLHLTQNVGTTARFEDTSGFVLATCTTSTMTATSENEGAAAETVRYLVNETTWGAKETECTSEVVTLERGSLELHWIEGTANGTLTSKNAKITIKSATFGSCVYGTGAGIDLGKITGGKPAIVDINAVLPRVTGSGLLCPETIKLVATYTMTEPDPAISGFWVAKET